MDYTRQLDIVPIERLQATTVHLIGAGGIGSPAGIALAKMGIGRLELWDDDRVEDHNLPNQLHGFATSGLAKVDSLRMLIEGFVGNEVQVVNHFKRLDNSRIEGVVVSTVDSMKSREAIWEVAKYSFDVDFFIDARMGGQLLRLYSLNPHDPLAEEDYGKMLYSDEESMQIPCTAQNIIYMGMLAGSLVANAVKRFVAGEPAVFEVVFDLSSFTLLTR